MMPLSWQAYRSLPMKDMRARAMEWVEDAEHPDTPGAMSKALLDAADELRDMAAICQRKQQDLRASCRS